MIYFQSPPFPNYTSSYHIIISQYNANRMPRRMCPPPKQQYLVGMQKMSWRGTTPPYGGVIMILHRKSGVMLVATLLFVGVIAYQPRSRRSDHGHSHEIRLSQSYSTSMSMYIYISTIHPPTSNYYHHSIVLHKIPNTYFVT